MKRRKSAAPQEEVDVLREQVANLQKQVKMIRQAGVTTIQADRMDRALSPVPWEVMINYPGTHIDAVEDDPFVYYHPGEVNDAGTVVEEGFKSISPLAAGELSTAYVEWDGDSSLPQGAYTIEWDKQGIPPAYADTFEITSAQPTRLKLKKAGVYLFGMHCFRYIGTPAKDWKFAIGAKLTGGAGGTATGAEAVGSGRFYTESSQFDPDPDHALFMDWGYTSNLTSYLVGWFHNYESENVEVFSAYMWAVYVSSLFPSPGAII
jgi:hypothetical protein